MKLKEYIEGLQVLVDKHGDLDVVYSSDAEGNSHHSVDWGPSLGNFDPSENQFIHAEEADWYKEYNEVDEMPINAVLIN